VSPKEIIENGKMHPKQWLAIAIIVGLNALDGFDVLSSAFAGPGIKGEWQLRPDGLGIVLAMELVGMGVGSLLLGSLADKYGRRPTILACLAFMATGMFLATCRFGGS
jgi:MFS family permease